MYQLLRQHEYFLKFITSTKLLQFHVSKLSNKRLKQQLPLTYHLHSGAEFLEDDFNKCLSYEYEVSV